jgi:uncharacterized protein (DUF952 family)
MNEEYIYHVISQEDWNQVVNSEKYAPPSLIHEGFIHFSFANQIPGVIDRYYRDQKNLLVLKINKQKLLSRLVVENLAGTGSYPHLYGELNLDAVVANYPLLWNEKNQIYWIED